MSVESLPRAGDNHFNLLRMIAASAVIVSHACPLSLGANTTEPLEAFVGFSLGTAAVKAFFAISGYFIFLSFERRRSNVAFVVARAARILPGLSVVALLTAFVVGPIFTTSAGYFADHATWTYVPRTVSILGIGAWLPVFKQNPYPISANGSLWTLYYEAACYTGLFLTGLAGLLRKRQMPWLLAAYLAAYAVAASVPRLAVYAHLSLPFVVGMTVYRFPRLLSGYVALALCVAAVAFSVAGFANEELWSVAIGYGALWLGFARCDRLLPYSRIGDFSYGTYIYGFLVEQMIAASIPGITPALMIALALPLSWGAGYLSWHRVEEPGLRLKNVRLRAWSNRELPT